MAVFERIKLKKQIRRSKKSIEELEQKRYRSQAALVSAILAQESPNDEDVEYFNGYTAKINAEREQLRAAMAELSRLSGDKIN